MAKSDGAEYVRCSNRACGYFCLLDQLPSYERVVRLNVARAFIGGDALLCQHRNPAPLGYPVRPRTAAALTSPTESVGLIRFSAESI